MKPEVTRVLNGLAETVTDSLGPELATPFARTNAFTTARLMRIAAHEFDRAAARLVEENDAIRALLAEGTRVVDEDALKARCLALAAEVPVRNYRVSTLQAENDLLKAALIDLHIHVEGRDDDAARSIDNRIWDELRASVARHSPTWG